MCRRAVLLALGVVAGCGSFGPAYQPVATTPDMGVVYVYRPKHFIGGAAEHRVQLANTTGEESRHEIVLRNGGYYPFVSKPGLVTVTTANSLGRRLRRPGRPGWARLLVREGLLQRR